MYRLVTLLLLLPFVVVAADDASLGLAAFHESGPQPSPLLILGTFHFKDAGLDAYKPEVDFDALSAPRQQEIKDIVERLAEFSPAIIALEARPERSGNLQAQYAAYRRGEFELPANEIYQLGFRLAHRLGHERVHFVDAEARRFEFGDIEKRAAECGQDINARTPWEDRYFALYRHDDRAKAASSLRETLLYMNSTARIDASHGHYLVGGFHLGCEKHPHLGADWTTGWYNRNLRIFANLGQLRQPGKPMLLIIGAGHLPIIRHAAATSPEFDLREVAAVLGN